MVGVGLLLLLLMLVLSVVEVCHHFVLQSVCDLRPNPNGKDSEQSSQNQDSKHRSTGHPDVVSLTVDCRLS